MRCRPGCGACCIVPSINSPIPGMPNGKMPGIKCVNLSKELKCNLFNSPDRPEFCILFKPEKIICGNSRKEAIQILSELEGIDYKE